MTEIIDGVFRDKRLKIDTNILRTDDLRKGVERYRDEICSEMVSGSMLNPQWIQMRAKKNKVRDCIRFLQIEAIIDNVCAVIIQNIQQIKDDIDEKILEYTEHDNDVAKVTALQTEIYAAIDSMRVNIDSPAFHINLSLPSNSTKQLAQSAIDRLQSDYTQDREVISIQSSAERF